jgi:hypothetical protein
MTRISHYTCSNNLLEPIDTSRKVYFSTFLNGLKNTQKKGERVIYE